MTQIAAAVEIIGHRGASYDAPENTVASVKLAFEQKADATEVDIYLTKDGKIAVIHDKTTKRTGKMDRPVVEQTFEELRQLDVGSWKGERWKGERIPSLEECLNALPDGKRIFIEVKSGPEILPELERVLKEVNKPTAQLVIISFNFDVVKLSRERLPEVPAYWLMSYKEDRKTKKLPELDDLIAKAKKARLSGLNLNYEFPIDEAFVKKVKDAGMDLYVWTVNDAEIAKRLAKAGVNGITTDRPAWLREQVSKE